MRSIVLNAVRKRLHPQQTSPGSPARLCAFVELARDIMQVRDLQIAHSPSNIDALHLLRAPFQAFPKPDPKPPHTIIIFPPRDSNTQELVLRVMIVHHAVIAHPRRVRATLPLLRVRLDDEGEVLAPPYRGVGAPDLGAFGEVLVLGEPVLHVVEVDRGDEGSVVFWREGLVGGDSFDFVDAMLAGTSVLAGGFAHVDLLGNEGRSGTVKGEVIVCKVMLLVMSVGLLASQHVEKARVRKQLELSSTFFPNLIT